MQQSTANHAAPSSNRDSEPAVCWDGELALRAITGEETPTNELLQLVAERIKTAAHYLALGRKDLHRIFSRHDVFEGEMQVQVNGRTVDFILVETYHHIQGMLGKGALKLIFPQDLAGNGTEFEEIAPGIVEVKPPASQSRWASQTLAEERVKWAMREFMTGETLSMSLKSQATGAPFAGSEGLVLCAVREFNEETGRYLLKATLDLDGDRVGENKLLVELMMNQAAEMLTRSGRIAFDRIVHAAETNSTLTAQLDLQLPTSVVEGHLRTLLHDDPNMVIGDDDMTARLRELLRRSDYAPGGCILAKAAARMQMEHSVLLSSSRAKLRQLLSDISGSAAPTAAQYREVVDLFFGAGETHQVEDRLYHHREPVLKSLSVALSARSLDDCGEPEVLAFYLKTLLDNQRIMLEAALLKRLPPGQPLPMDWFERAPLLTGAQERRLAALAPFPGITRDKVKENFWEVVNILCEAKGVLPRYTPDPHLQARKELLERATRAITAAAEVVPPSDRILFFTLPYTYECVTPKLGVVTRKPVSVCGSELRPEAMAAGGVMSVEIFLKKLKHEANPLRGLRVAIEGLGNAGKHVATSMLQKGATIVAVSDSRGALLCHNGFTREELAVIIAHKNSGRRLHTLLDSPAAQEFLIREGSPIVFCPQPEKLQQSEADILVLAAIPGTVHAENAPSLKIRVVCELTGAAITGEAKKMLKQRGIHVIPDNLASSGGLLVSLSEMLQNSAGQNWDRKLEEANLYQQLSRSLDDVLALTEKHDVDVPTASDILALSRMHDLAIYREHLEAAAARLAERMRGIAPGEGILIASDEDEDGIASAAMIHTMIAMLNPGAESRVQFASESFRDDGILEHVRRSEGSAFPIKHVFVLDRAFPVSETGRARIAELLAGCQLAIINNHSIAPELLEDPAGQVAALLKQAVLVSPQVLKATGSASHFSTAMILREIACLLDPPAAVMAQINWQAAVASCLDTPDVASQWLWFLTQFNPDRTTEAAKAVRMVTRAGGFLNAVHAMVSVTRPDQLETHQPWQQFMTEYGLLKERVQVLVDKIAVENRGRPYVAHFFTHDEIASPTPVAGNASNELDLYHWISEHLTRRGNFSEKPIIVGQFLRDEKGGRWLGVRIRSPRGIDLMEVGLPNGFKTGGLPNTAVARMPLAAEAQPEEAFQLLVDEIWIKATNPMYLSSSADLSG